MDWLSHFGFHTTPFTPEIGVSQRFGLDTFDAALKGLLQNIHMRFSAALIGASGTGKSALLRAINDALPDARFRVSYVKVTGLSKRDLCREVATALGAKPAGSYPVLIRTIQDHMLSCTETDGLRPVILFDDAHEFRPDVLGILRVLSNFEMDSRLVVSFVLAGQTPLRTLLRRDNLEDVARRLTYYATLRLLSRDEIGRYLTHRCTIAGADTLPFDTPALDAIYEVGRGNLRASDQLARVSLQIAADLDHPVVGTNHVVDARKLLWP